VIEKHQQVAEDVYPVSPSTGSPLQRPDLAGNVRACAASRGVTNPTSALPAISS